MEAINDYFAGVIKVHHTSEDTNDLENIVSISIYRRCTNAFSSDLEWTIAGTKPVITNDDKDFVFVDYSARHGEKYKYKTVIKVMENDVAVSYDGATCEVDSVVCGIVIGADDKYYSINFNVSYTTQREYNMAYVQPYYSKYPHAIQNGDANFNTGSVSGYFNLLDSNCSLEEKTGMFAEEVEEFLTNGKVKTLKTYDGYVWRIMVDSPIKREKTDSRGLVYFNFSWHAVAAPVPTGFFI